MSWADISLDPGELEAAPTGTFRFRAFARHILRLVHRQFEAERDHLVLWLVVGLGSGIALYFSLPFEPPVSASVAFFALGLLLFVRFRQAALLPHATSAFLLSVSVGFGAADLRTALVAAPVLARATGPAALEGLILSRDFNTAGGVQLVVEVKEFAHLAPEQLPRRVRLTLRKGLADAAPGAQIRVIAKLMPPSGPAAPGAFDFARKAFFQGIGAVGFGLGAPQILVPATGNPLAERVSHWREQVAAQIGAAIPGASGGIAVALATGLRGAVPQQADDELRASGLTHLLSISGLHISVVALALFGAFRLLLVCSEFVALRFATKKWAAGAAIIGVCAYTQITGASIPAERSFIMCALVLLAVIADRRALTLRNVALAGGLVLLVLPENLLDVSFQMSFAATLALIAAFEYWNKRARTRPIAPKGAWFWKTIDHMRGLVMTSLVAGIATAPFSAYHFQTVAAYGLLSNMIAVPLTGMIVMPALLLAYLLMPLGLAGPVLYVAGLGLDGVLAVAHMVAHLPGAVLNIRSGPMSALALISFGGLWLCLWQTRLRLYGLVFVTCGLVIWALDRPPDVLISRDLKSIAVREGGGELTLLDGKATSFEALIWMRRAGYGVRPLEDQKGAQCDALGCTLTLADGQRLALSLSPASLDDDCREGGILISAGRVRRACLGPNLVIDRITAARYGSIAIWSRGGALTLKGAGGELDGRPWSPKRPVFKSFRPTNISG